VFLETPYGPIHLTLAEQMEYPAGFCEWISSNWHVYQAFVELAREGHRNGLRNWGAFAVINLMRWQASIRERGGRFKCNNNYAPGMSRLAMRQFPELRGFFRCRGGFGFAEERKKCREER
jgi:hypothetical protein